MAQKLSHIPEPIHDDEQFVLDAEETHITSHGYSSYGTSIQPPIPEIVREFQELPIEPEVIARAVAIFYRINDSNQKSIKGSRKKRTMFWCVLSAYNELDYPVDPCYAANLVGLPQTDTEHAINEWCPSGMILFEPTKMIQFYIHRFNALLANEGLTYDTQTVIQGVTAVIETCKSSQAGREWVQNNAAKIVTVTALYFYLNDLKAQDISRHIKLFEDACYLSWACIRRYHDQIIKYYNMEGASISPQIRTPSDWF